MQRCRCFDVVVRRKKKLLFKLPRDQRWGHVNSGAHHRYAAWWPWLNDIDIDISIYTYNVQRITTENSWRGRPTTSLPFLSLYVNYSTNHPTNHRNPLPPFDSEINRKPYKKTTRLPSPQILLLLNLFREIPTFLVAMNGVCGVLNS